MKVEDLSKIFQNACDQGIGDYEVTITGDATVSASSIRYNHMNKSIDIMPGTFDTLEGKAAHDLIVALDKAKSLIQKTVYNNDLIFKNKEESLKKHLDGMWMRPDQIPDPFIDILIDVSFININGIPTESYVTGYWDPNLDEWFYHSMDEFRDSREIEDINMIKRWMYLDYRRNGCE